MIIVFDIDDTITKETEFVLKYAPVYLKKRFDCHFDIKNYYGYNLSEIYDLKDFCKQKLFLDKEDSIRKVLEIENDFWNKYFLKYIFYPINNDIKKISRKLKKEGHTLYFITTRGKETKNFRLRGRAKIQFAAVWILTTLQLKLNGIKYYKLFLVKDNTERISQLKELKAEIYFDDNRQIIEEVSNQMKIKSVCIKATHNKNYTFLNKKIAHIDFNYNEVLNVVNSQIPFKQQLRKLNKVSWLCSEFFYTIFRMFGKQAVLKHYNPLIIGASNIPVNRNANVFIGNHRDIKDPLITIALLKIPVHFAALKRMFEHGDNLFGKTGKNFGTYLTTFFMKTIGALPIAREEDNEYITTNLQTFQCISDYLKLNSSVMIYPEGTLNRNPNVNGDMLPLKSHHAFKVAEKGKGIVRPIAIVWLPKKLDIGHRVIIAFLEPIRTENKRAKEISQEWLEKMTEAISKINSVIEILTSIK